MRNIFVIAHKEFIDLLYNKMVFIVLVIFLVYIMSIIYSFKVTLDNTNPGIQLMFGNNTGIAAANYIYYTLAWFGSILGIVIGCSAISTERIGGALNTLASKPLYRDTIINGKIAGSLLFLACVEIFYIAIFTSGFLVLCGNALIPFLQDYFLRLPFIFLFIMTFTLVFLSLSMFISLIIRDQAFAMILSTLMVYFSLFFAISKLSVLDKIIPGLNLGSLMMNMSLYTIVLNVQRSLMNTDSSAYQAFQSVVSNFVTLLLFVAAVMIINYIIFIWKDIS